MVKFTGKEWRDFLTRIVIVTVVSFIAGWLVVAGENTKHYYAPFLFLAFISLSGMDVVMEHRVLKKRLVLMMHSTKRWEVPMVLGPSASTLIWGVQTDDNPLFALIWSSAIFVLMVLAMTRRKKKIAHLLDAITKR